MSSRENTI
jgi:hypothetical protein